MFDDWTKTYNTSDLVLNVEETVKTIIKLVREKELLKGKRFLYFTKTDKMPMAVDYDKLCVL